MLTFGSLTHGLTGRVSESSPRHAKSRIPARGIRDFVSKWRDYRASLARNLNRRDCPQGRSLVSVEKSADEISSTGGRRRLSPRPFGPEFENVLIFPTLSANIRKLPVFSAFFQLFPPVSGNFHAVLNWTFGVFLQFYRFNHPLQPTGLQHDRTALFYIPSATHFASSTFRSSLAFNSSST